jgi:hypothetical protein
MKRESLEDFVKKNREKFDDLEPTPRVWKGIEKNSRKSKKVSIVPMLFRVAAVLAIVITTSVILLNNLANNRTLSHDPELKELIEAESFYAQEVNTKLKEIRKCYYTYPELKNDIETDLNELEYMYIELKKDLKQNISNKDVIEAMIENNRYRLKLVDDVLEQINC